MQPIRQGVTKLVHNQLDPRVPILTKKFDEKDIVLLTMKGCQQWKMMSTRYLENTLNYITINLKIIMLLVINLLTMNCLL